MKWSLSDKTFPTPPWCERVRRKDNIIMYVRFPIRLQLSVFCRKRRGEKYSFSVEFLVFQFRISANSKSLLTVSWARYASDVTREDDFTSSGWSNQLWPWQWIHHPIVTQMMKALNKLVCFSAHRSCFPLSLTQFSSFSLLPLDFPSLFDFASHFQSRRALKQKQKKKHTARI